jgi:hypothetical protein
MITINEPPAIYGSVPIKIKNKWICALIFIGCIIPPVVAYFLGTGSEHYMPNKLAAFFLIPMSVSLILLPFTGLPRKILYAIPIPIILMFTSLSLFTSWVSEKIKNPQDEPKHPFLAMILYAFDLTVSVIFGWLLIGVGTLILIMTIATINK